MKRLGLVSALVLFATACGGDPPAVEHEEVQRTDLEQAAYELQQMQNGHGMFAVKFTNRRPEKLARRMAWFRYEIGTCDRYELYQDFGPKLARFLYHCERGQLEALIGVDDDGRVNELRTGARGVNPPEQVRTAAERWLESPAAEANAKGCRIDRVHVGAVTGALFVLSCPTGEKTLIIGIDRNDQPRRLEVIDHALDVWRIPADVG